MEAAGSRWSVHGADVRLQLVCGTKNCVAFRAADFKDVNSADVRLQLVYGTARHVTLRAVDVVGPRSSVASADV